MASSRNPVPIRIGLVSDEPIRLEGLAVIFDLPAEEGHAQLLPVPGSLDELLTSSQVEYLVVDLHSSSAVVQTLHAIRRARPNIRLIVIGPQGNDELIFESIIAGVRAYLDSTAEPETVRKALEVVIGGSIWVPRRLLSQLIDRLLRVSVSDSSLTNAGPHLTAREHQVLDLILRACSDREIASELGIGERTVKAYVGRLMHKIGVDNRIKLIVSAHNHPPLPQDTPTQNQDAGLPRRSFTND